jgi:plastocyanin
MSRVLLSVLLVLVAVFALAPSMPAAAIGLADCQIPCPGFGGFPTGFGTVPAGFGTFPAGFGTFPAGFGGLTPATTAATTATTATTAVTDRGCGRGPGIQNVSAGAITELPRVTISIQDGFFLPAELTVQRGTVVRWVNQGTQPHTTTRFGSWDSGILRPGESCIAWFVTPGSWDYLSIVAADDGRMTGVINVSETPIGGGPPAPAPATVPGTTGPGTTSP